MKKIIFPEKLIEKNSNQKIAILGKFESMHIGHLELIKSAKKIADENNYEIILMLFSQRKNNNFISFEKRSEIANKYGVNYLLEFEPKKSNFEITYSKFNDYLVNLNVKSVVVGHDFRYGKNREGDINKLKEKFDVNILDEILVDNEPVRTSNLIDAINNNDLEKVFKITNRYFSYEGIVVKGEGNGKKFGMPTANVDYPDYKIKISDGIYFSYATLSNNKRMPSLTSISNNPTLNANKITYETFIYNFNSDIYGKELKIELIKKYRDPINFSSIDDLIKKLEEDKKLGKKFFNLM